MSVIFQLFHAGQWHDAAELTFTDDELITYLQEITKRLKNLPTLLLDAGCPSSIVYFPSIGLDFLESKFVQMGVVDE